jgi:phenylpropionate dioxygenase-like ring-hydroxylating dioxygenase large terminal subunit
MTAPLAAPLRDDQRAGLPGWAYHSPALLDLERREVFATHWQVAGHVADLPRPGDWIAFDWADERALVLRGEDGTLRAFHNLCRHRGARVAAGEAGHCRNALVCPFHGWVYNLDGTLRGPARPASFGAMDRARFGLVPMEMEVWQGLIFLRARPGPQPPVAELLAPFEAELAPFALAAMLPAGPPFAAEVPVNWKSVRDVDNEGYHVAMAHPALQDLYGAGYRDEVLGNGLSRSIGPFDAHPPRRWSVRLYRALGDPAPGLPPEARSRWAYYGIFPNTVIAVAPESVQVYHESPLAPRRSLLRGRAFRFARETRRQRLARYLAARIDRETYQEDIRLSVWSDEAMRSSAFPGFHLSDHEIALRAHHDALRAVLPVLGLPESPGEDRMAATNAALRDGRPEPSRRRA